MDTGFRTRSCSTKAQYRAELGEETMTTALDRFRLDGQVAVITGGARGIGRATAEAFVAAGARAILVDLDLEEAKKTALALNNAEAHAINVTLEAEVDAFFDDLAARLGTIDIL